MNPLKPNAYEEMTRKKTKKTNKKSLKNLREFNN